MRRAIRPWIAGFGRRCDGVAAVEFAIVANVFIMLVAGIAGFGVLMNATHSLHQMSAEAARAAVAGLTEQERADIAGATISELSQQYPFLKEGEIKSIVSHPSPSQISVTVSYDRMDLPVLSMLSGLDMLQGRVSASSTVRVESE